MVGIIPLYIATATGTMVLVGLCVPAGDWDVRNINRTDNNGNRTYRYQYYYPYKNNNGSGYYLNNYYTNRFDNRDGYGYVQEKYNENFDQRGRNVVCYGFGSYRRCYNQDNNGSISDNDRYDNNNVYYPNDNAPYSYDSYGRDNNSSVNGNDGYRNGDGRDNENVVCRGFGSYRRCYNEPSNTYRYPGTNYSSDNVPRGDYQNDSSRYQGGASGY